ncbi:MAG: MG2 domain-containing protein [Crocinitomicaceae bacterium]|nr:MG2 domain-containing protein [Crocinitomicaceae bacterium]
MKRSKTFFKCFAALLATILFSACGPTKPELIQVDPGFNVYISGYTSGMIQRQDNIRIELKEDLEGLESFSEDNLLAMFEFEPAISGKVVVIGERLIEFIPDEMLPVNQFYTVRFQLDELIEVESGFEEFAFQFATFGQKLSVEIDGLRNYSQYDIDYQYLEGSIGTTDYETEENIRETIKITLDGKEIPFRFDGLSYSDRLNFVVDSIERLEKEQYLKIEWNGVPIGSFSQGSEEVVISSLNDFSVSRVEVLEDEDQKVELTFTEPISSRQNLNGIITIDGIDDLKFDIQRNLVTVFIPNRVIGRKTLTVNTGIKNVADAKMKEEFTRSLMFHEAFPMVRLEGSGSILPNSQGLIFPFEAIALKSVDVRIIRIHENNVHHFLQVNELNDHDELTRFGKIIAETKVVLDGDEKKDLKQWNTHIIDLEKFIKAEQGAIYQVAIKFNKDDAICDCTLEDEENGEQEEDEEEVPDFLAEDPDWNENLWHTWGYDGYSSWNSYYEELESPCSYSYYYGRAVTRNILASNIGMIFKLDEDKTAHIILSDMVTTLPISGAKVSFYDYQKQLITTVSSNSQGMGVVKLDRKPFLMIARKGSQRGYMKLSDGHVNSLSKFDIDGEVVQKGVKGFIYGERGVWRPGDSLYLTFMLQDKNNVMPKNHPINFEFLDPNGNVIYEVSRTSNVNGVYDFRTATSEDAPTGSYQARVRVGSKIYTKTCKIETIKPNRLKVDLDVGAGNNEDTCVLEAKWLHGASAQYLRADVQVRLTPMRTMFKGYKGYSFDSPVRNGRSGNKTIFDDLLDSLGQAHFVSNLSTVQRSSGMLQAHYSTKVYEKGGNFSIDTKVRSFSPYRTYIGIKTPSAHEYDNTVNTDEDQRFQLVSLDEEGKPVSGVKLKINVYKTEWNWWYDGEENFATFTSRNSAVLYMDTMVVTSKGKSSFTLNIPNEDYGKYLITVTDLEGKHQTGKIVHFDWPYWSRANRTENEFASMLSFSIDKEKYIKGDKIKLTFPSPSAGRALISIETSEKVIKKFWITTKKGETTHSFTATGDMAPNAFIHITMVQPHNATTNDLPIRMYGVMPVQVDDPNTHLKPLISMKDKIRPDSRTNITIREDKGKKMTYTIAIVDDGLLDLTNYQTPQPWNTFYAREALGVQTWDMYDDVIGAYAGKLDQLLSIGGDGSAIVGNGPKASRFKPMVRFLGPFELPAGGSRTHAVDIPNYVGSVRVMVIGRDNESYGNAQKTVVVKKPLMVLATVPRVLGPGEDFVLPVDVFAMEDHIKNVNVSIEVNGMFSLEENKQKTIQFSAQGDEIVNFRLKTKEKLGIGKIKVTVRSGNEVSTQEIEVDIRPSNPVVYDSQKFELASGEELDANVILDGLAGTNFATVEVSTMPSINLEKRLAYLMEYPHGCVEQTTSSVFPQLFLGLVSELSVSEKKHIDANIKAGIERLQLFQTMEGGFSYWPGEMSESEWGTNYAGHFLLEAELKGYRLPTNMKKRWISYQKDQARNWTLNTSVSEQLSSSEQLTQAYRLYLLAMCGSQELGAMNRLREQKNLSNMARWRLASAYVLIGQPEIATSMVKTALVKVNPYRELTYSFGSDVRDRAIILEVQGMLGDEEGGFETLKKVADRLSTNQWMSTQETAYSLLAVAKYCQVGANGGASKIKYTWNGESVKTRTVGSKIIKFSITESKGEKRSIHLENTGGSKLFVNVVTQKIPFKERIEKKMSNLTIRVNYTDMNGRTISVASLEQGTEFIASVTLHNPTMDKWYREMALSQIFPSGWEIHNSRLYGTKGVQNDVRHQDIRDDRVYSYYALAPNQTKTVKIVLNATYQGRFFLPAVYSEAMYDHEISALLPGKWVEVKPQE